MGSIRAKGTPRNNIGHYLGSSLHEGRFWRAFYKGAVLY